MLGELPLTQDIELAFVPGEEGFWQEYAAGGRDLIEKYREAIDDLAADLQVKRQRTGTWMCIPWFFPRRRWKTFICIWQRPIWMKWRSFIWFQAARPEEYREELLGAKASGMFDGMGEEIVNGQIRVRDGVIQDISLEIQLEEGVSLLLNGSLQNTIWNWRHPCGPERRR